MTAIRWVRTSLTRFKFCEPALLDRDCARDGGGRCKALSLPEPQLFIGWAWSPQADSEDAESCRACGGDLRREWPRVN